MSTPIGHTLFGLTLARRLGVRTPFGMGASVVAASLPDADVLMSWALQGDPWKMHRKGTHTIGFAATAGMLAGFAGLVSGGNAEGERDVVMDGLVGALIVGSHVVLDSLPFPYFDTKKEADAGKLRRNVALNWLLDAVVYGAIAYRFWPRARA
jgi:membrane-bound metal-dependent hydrolase YbcI (DUF457 family)